MRRIIAFALLILGTLQVTSQTPLYRNYTTKDGLASNETYCIFQDSYGYIWIGTDNGIQKFDGHRFLSYKIDGRPFNKTVFNIIESKDGRIWLSTYKSGIYYISNDTLYSHPLNQQIISNTAATIINKIIPYDKGIYFSTTKENKHYFYLTQGELKKVNYPIKSELSINLKVINNELLYNNLLILDTIDNNSKYTDFLISAKNDAYTIKTSSFTEFNNATVLGDGRIIITTSTIGTDNENFILIYRDTKSPTFIPIPARAISIYVDNQQRLFVGTEKGIGIINLATKKYNFNWIFKDIAASSIIKDNKDRYWLSTVDKGIFYISNWTIKKLSDNIYKSIALIDTIVYTTGNSIISKSLFSNEKRLTNNIEVGIKDYIIYKTLPNFSGTLLSVDSGKTFSRLHHNISVYKTPIPNITSLVNYKNQIFLVTNNHVMRCDSIGMVIDYPVWDKSKKLLISDIHIYNDTFWAASSSGLFKKHINAKHTDSLLETPINDNIRAICGNKNIIYIISSSRGLIKLDITSNLFSILNSHIKNYDVYSMDFDNEKNNLFIISKLGFHIYNLKENNLFDIAEFSRNQIGRIFDFAFNNDIGYLASEAGLFKFNLNKLIKDDNTTVHITSITSKKQSGINNILKLYSNKNDITFSYLGINYAYSEPILYKYTLNGYTVDTITTTNSEIQYTNLSAGKYEFKVWASVDGKLWSKSPDLFSFTVMPHYTETWWFISLLLLGGLLIVSSIFLLIIRNLKRRNAIQKELLLLEQKALRAQMNPHFTFNALNSIQYFITDNNKRAATTFLSKFSKLVRNILNNSKTNTISLADEISTLTTYLELEQMRFNGKIAIAIHVGDNLMPDDIFIPSMIIQPFLENAIWHGIMPREDDKGKLELSFELKGSTLVCTIKDNGIGRKRSAELKEQTRKGHKSTGLKNIEDRIKVLNHINESNISLKIIDLYNHAGTEVIICFDLH